MAGGPSRCASTEYSLCTTSLLVVVVMVVVQLWLWRLLVLCEAVFSLLKRPEVICFCLSVLFCGMIAISLSLLRASSADPPSFFTNRLTTNSFPLSCKRRTSPFLLAAALCSFSLRCRTCA